MNLRSQAGERGYAMAALLVALAIMAILMSVAMPVWRQEARREKEAELVFRGEQYARAIALYRFKNANIPNAYPPSIDALVQGRFLRKKYKDPMSADGEFVLIGLGTPQPGLGQPGQKMPGQTQGTPPNPMPGRANAPTQPNQPNIPGGSVVGGMTGVRSKSTESSLRTYRGATRYDQWMFTFNIAPRPGGAMPMANSPEGGMNNPNNPNFPGNPTFPGGNRGGNRGGNTGGNRGGNRGAGPGGFTPPPPVTFPGSNPTGRGRGM
jgi:type II secretory pathway pseudopilin PulG